MAIAGQLRSFYPDFLKRNRTNSVSADSSVTSIGFNPTAPANTRGAIPPDHVKLENGVFKIGKFPPKQGCCRVSQEPTELQENQSEERDSWLQ